jgi:hypothetical protein
MPLARESRVFNFRTIYGELKSRAVTENRESIAELHKAKDKINAIMAGILATN